MAIPLSNSQKQERGQTIVLVAVALLALLSMAALAIDVVTLYVARSEAQRSANAAAIAGAKIFATSGATSVQTGPPAITLGDACNAAIAQAQAVALQNTVGGQTAVTTGSCNTGTTGNPQITVSVARTGLPTFFARIWSRASNSISATATAEAYNPSGNLTSIQVAVKPWLLPNCDSSRTTPANVSCPGSAYFVNPGDGSIANNGSFIGNTITLTRVPASGIAAANSFYTLDIPAAPTTSPAAVPVCPSTSAPSCGFLGTNQYHDNIACSSQVQFSCGQALGPGDINIDNTAGPGLGYTTYTDEGTQCLIHANNRGINQGQDILTPRAAGQPIEITGGDNNPNPALQGTVNISRSDSEVTVPLYSGIRLCTNAACNVNTTVVGFLQLGITERLRPPNGRVKAIILNVAGCNPGNLSTDGTISGGGVSPVPVRLIGP